MEERTIKVAKTAGFCFGVKRAVEKVYEQVELGKENIFTYGPIIHNEEVVADLESKGVRVLASKEELEMLREGTVVIRSHGVPKEIYQLIEAKGLECVDATCPFVKKIHRIVEKESNNGRHIIIIGNDKHPEVEGIKGWCNGPVTVISDEEEAENLAVLPEEKLCIVSQTTFNYNKFQELVEILEKKRYDRIVLNTICSATEERQLEARQIACEADTMIVIGGRHSSNTQKLYEICRKECKNTYYIQTLVDLDTRPFQCIGCVGITAGASTPNNIIEEVHKHVRIKF
ncbi:MAG: 4-hydroxy-3-methylbut-2-enyl diphosphate reductase [Oliverpabstia sp.]